MNDDVATEIAPDLDSREPVIRPGQGDTPTLPRRPFFSHLPDRGAIIRRNSYGGGPKIHRFLKSDTREVIVPYVVRVASTSHIHGLNDIFTAKTLQARVFWTLVCIVCLVAAAYEISRIVYIYRYRYEGVATKISMEKVEKMKFPTVLLCPTRWIHLDLPAEYGLSDATLEYLVSKILDGGLPFSERDYSADQLWAPDPIHLSKLETTRDKNNFQTMADLLLNISGRSNDNSVHQPHCSCCNGSPRPIVTLAGVCFVVELCCTSFQMDNPPSVIYNSAHLSNHTIIGDTNHGAFIALMDNRSQIGILPEISTFVQEGHCTLIKLEYWEMERISTKEKPCISYEQGEKYESPIDCEYQCRDKFMNRPCQNCSRFSFFDREIAKNYSQCERTIHYGDERKNCNSPAEGAFIQEMKQQRMECKKRCAFPCRQSVYKITSIMTLGRSATTMQRFCFEIAQQQYKKKLPAQTLAFIKKHTDTLFARKKSTYFGETFLKKTTNDRGFCSEPELSQFRRTNVSQARLIDLLRQNPISSTLFSHLRLEDWISVSATCSLAQRVVASSLSCLKTVNIEEEIARVINNFEAVTRRESLMKFTRYISKKCPQISGLGPSYVPPSALTNFTQLTRLHVDFGNKNRQLSHNRLGINVESFQLILRKNLFLEELCIKGALPKTATALFGEHCPIKLEKLDLRDATLGRPEGMASQGLGWFTDAMTCTESLREFGVPEVRLGMSRNFALFIEKCRNLETLSFSVLHESFQSYFTDILLGLPRLKTLGSFGGFEWYCTKKVLIPFLSRTKCLTRLRILVWFLGRNSESPENSSRTGLLHTISSTATLTYLNVSFMGSGSLSVLKKLVNLRTLCLTIIETPSHTAPLKNTDLESVVNDGLPRLTEFVLNFWIRSVEEEERSEVKASFHFNRSLDMFSLSSLGQCRISFGSMLRDSVTKLGFSGVNVLSLRETLSNCQRVRKLDISKLIASDSELEEIRNSAPSFCIIRYPDSVTGTVWQQTDESITSLLGVVSSYYENQMSYPG